MPGPKETVCDEVPGDAELVGAGTWWQSEADGPSQTVAGPSTTPVLVVAVAADGCAVAVAEEAGTGRFAVAADEMVVVD